METRSAFDPLNTWTSRISLFSLNGKSALTTHSLKAAVSPAEQFGISNLAFQLVIRQLFFGFIHADFRKTHLAKLTAPLNIIFSLSNGHVRRIFRGFTATNAAVKFDSRRCVIWTLKYAENIACYFHCFTPPNLSPNIRIHPRSVFGADEFCVKMPYYLIFFASRVIGTFKVRPNQFYRRNKRYRDTPNQFAVPARRVALQTNSIRRPVLR